MKLCPHTSGASQGMHVISEAARLLQQGASCQVLSNRCQVLSRCTSCSGHGDNGIKLNACNQPAWCNSMHMAASHMCTKLLEAAAYAAAAVITLPQY